MKTGPISYQQAKNLFPEEVGFIIQTLQKTEHKETPPEDLRWSLSWSGPDLSKEGIKILPKFKDFEDFWTWTELRVSTVLRGTLSKGGIDSWTGYSKLLPWHPTKVKDYYQDMFEFFLKDTQRSKSPKTKDPIPEDLLEDLWEI